MRPTLICLCLALMATSAACISPHRSKLGARDADEAPVYVLLSQDDRAATPRISKDPDLQEAKRKAKAKAKGPVTHAALISRARLAIATGDYRGAEALATRALQQDFRNRDAKIVLAHVAYMEDRTAQAQAILTQLNGTGARESDVLNLLGRIHWDKGEVLVAEGLFAKAVALNPDDCAARLNWGLALLRRDVLKEAEKQFLEVQKRMPDNVDARVHLGVSLSRQGKVAKAEEVYKQALRKAPDHPLLLTNLALVLTRANKFDEAIDVLESTLEQRSLKLSQRDEVESLLEKVKVANASQESEKKLERLLVEARQSSMTEAPETFYVLGGSAGER